MWMEELPNGKFKYFERYKDPYTEKLKKVYSNHGEENSPGKKSSCYLVTREDK
ncbi:integrase [Streptococcus pneumoniae GA14688]|nr:integrase [Streptococcus pneumoniae GA14688]